MSYIKDDIDIAVKNSDIFLKIPELKGAKPILSNDGKLIKYVGGFNAVYKLQHNGRIWALRIWHIDVDEQMYKARYKKISRYIEQIKLPYFAGFIYDEDGIVIKGIKVDTIRMEWLAGKRLYEYIGDNLHSKANLENLAEKFLTMCKDLHNAKISHGDLQHGNILIDKSGQIRLIDYDSVCTPDLEGEEELVTGLKGYQHPSRFRNKKLSLKSDYFSELVIYLSILAISEAPHLWTKYDIQKTEHLLFSETDFENPQQSRIFAELNQLSAKVKDLTKIIKEYLRENDFRKLKPFYALMVPPSIRSFTVDKDRILEGDSCEISWATSNSEKTYLNSIIVSDNGSKNAILNDKQIVLTAENAFGKAERTLNVQIFPKPEIKEFRSETEKIECGKTTQLIWDVQNAERIEIHYSGSMSVAGKTGNIEISPAQHTDYKIIVTAMDGITRIEKIATVQVFKKVIINKFISDFAFVVDSIPVTLDWDVENASEIIIEESNGVKNDVTGKSNYVDYLKDDKTYRLICRNDFFTAVSDPLRITTVKNKYDADFKGLVPKFNSIIPKFSFRLPSLESFSIEGRGIGDVSLPNLDVKISQKKISGILGQLSIEK